MIESELIESGACERSWVDHVARRRNEMLLEQSDGSMLSVRIFHLNTRSESVHENFVIFTLKNTGPTNVEYSLSRKIFLVVESVGTKLGKRSRSE